jgi:hypothetical protein
MMSSINAHANLHISIVTAMITTGEGVEGTHNTDPPSMTHKIHTRNASWVPFTRPYSLPSQGESTADGSWAGSLRAKGRAASSRRLSRVRARWVLEVWSREAMASSTKAGAGEPGAWASRGRPPLCQARI